jgi:hypothetical protein
MINFDDLIVYITCYVYTDFLDQKATAFWSALTKQVDD